MFSITPIMAAPIRAPAGLPTPPVKATPPITAAAIEFKTHNSPIAGCHEPSRATIIIPANAANKPVIIKVDILIKLTFIPSIHEATLLLPIAYI